MRCPKCGFNSFDHNLLCPKCRKDLSPTRRLLNLVVPAPGFVNFFVLASQAPLAALDASGDDDSLEPDPDDSSPAPPPALDEDLTKAAAEDILSDIFPAGSPAPAAEEIAPLEDIEEIDDIAPSPADPPEAKPAQAPPPRALEPVLPPAPEEPEPEIEIDIDFDDPEGDDGPAAAGQAALAQIKDTLTATGDLSEPPAPDPGLGIIPAAELDSAAAAAGADLDLAALNLDDEPEQAAPADLPDMADISLDDQAQAAPLPEIPAAPPGGEEINLDDDESLDISAQLAASDLEPNSAADSTLSPAKAPATPMESGDLTDLVDSLDIGDLDSE